MKDQSDDPSHHERTLLPRSYISLHKIRSPYGYICARTCVCIFSDGFFFFWCIFCLFSYGFVLFVSFTYGVVGRGFVVVL